MGGTWDCAMEPVQQPENNRLSAIDLKRLASKSLAASLRKVRLPTKPGFDYKKLDSFEIKTPYEKSVWKPCDNASMHTEANHLVTFPLGVPYTAEIKLAEEILTKTEPKSWLSGITSFWT